MITTASGLALPSVSAARKIQYYNEPDLLAMSRDMAAERRSSSYKIALHQNIASDGQKGRDFAEKAVALGTWYSPPRGLTINTVA